MAIDRKKIIQDLSKVEVLGGKNGLIEAFGVFVNQLPTQLWSDFAERLTAKADPDILPHIESLLINAAQECGYHTGYGIITSQEWKASVEPMVESKEDVLHGAFAVFSAWGWAQAEIIELVPAEKMVVRAYNYYEADGILMGQSDRNKAYMIQGVSAAFMALAYSGEYVTDDSKTQDYTCQQTKGIECGDDYGEFVISKA